MQFIHFRKRLHIYCMTRFLFVVIIKKLVTFSKRTKKSIHILYKEEKSPCDIMLTFEERKIAYRRLSQYNSNRFHLYQCRIIGQQQITREQYNYAIDNPQVLMSYIMNWSCHNQIWMCEFAMYATQFNDIAKIYYNIRRQLEMHQSKIPTPFRFYTPRLRGDRSNSSHAIEVLVACLFMNLFQYINGDEDNKRIDAFVDTFDPCVFGDVYVPFNIFAFWSVEELSRIYITE